MAGLVDTFVCIAFLANGEPVAKMESHVPDLQTEHQYLLGDQYRMTPEDWEVLALTDSQFVTDDISLTRQFEAGGRVLERGVFPLSSKEQVLNQRAVRKEALDQIDNAKNGRPYRACDGLLF